MGGRRKRMAADLPEDPGELREFAARLQEDLRKSVEALDHAKIVQDSLRASEDVYRDAATETLHQKRDLRRKFDTIASALAEVETYLPERLDHAPMCSYRLEADTAGEAACDCRLSKHRERLSALRRRVRDALAIAASLGDES